MVPTNEVATPEVHRVSADALRSLVTSVLGRVGLPPEDAAYIAEVMVAADLRGVDSHGITRLAGYVSMIRRGLLNPRPSIRVVQDSGACATLDGDQGFGMLAACQGMELAVTKARDHGLGMTTVRNTTHTGMIGFYTMYAASQGMVGIAMNNGPAIVPPFGGKTPTYATNPFSVAFPTGGGEPVVLDMATTMVAGGKFRLAVKKGVPIPREWGLDRNGLPTDDANEVIQHGFFQWAGGYKGFGLATMVEILGGVLSGGLFGTDVPPMKNFGEEPLISSGAYIAIDIQRFMPLEEFQARMDRLVAQVHASERATGVERIYVPGEPELEHRRERQASGIPLSDAVYRELESLSQELGVPFALA